ncbi:MAG: hypothetical protein JNM66_30380 [Bryobacterales bacterium]|nr:hypothetical protein [Bryobacterales bacterium]
MRWIVLVALITLMPGCADLLSVHSLATAESLTFDESLLGEWECAPKECKGTAYLRADAAARKTYDIVWVPGEGSDEPLRLRGQLVRVGSRIVLDLVTAKRADMAVPGHFFLLMQKRDDGLTFQWLDSEWLRQEAMGANGVAHTMIDDKPVLTAGSTAVQAFLLKFGQDSRAVSGGMVFKRTKRG